LWSAKRYGGQHHEVVIVTRREVAKSRSTRGKGKGRGHPAQLNMGDCFAYAMAASRNAKLLFKGNDFDKTDVRVPDF
jgi:ribonuclease VapC